MIAWFSLLACSPDPVADTDGYEPPDPHADFAEGPDYDAQCAGRWPLDLCGAGACPDSEIEGRYLDAYRAWFGEVSGLGSDEVDAHLYVRYIETHESGDGTPTTVHALVQLSWARVLLSASVNAGPDPSFEDALAAWREAAPAPSVSDWHPNARSHARLLDFVEACGTQHGVVFEPTFCDLHLPTGTDTWGDGPVYEFTTWIDDRYYVVARVPLLADVAPTCSQAEQESP